jgi:hypothetical protein
MSDDGVPEDLREGSEAPEGFEEKIEEAIHSQDPSLTLLSIEASDPLEEIRGNFEQRQLVRVFRERNGSEERGFATVDVNRRNGELEVEVLEIQI